MYDLILANFALHISLSAQEAVHLVAQLQHKQVKKNAVVLQAGEVCRNIYFVNKGCLRVFNTDEAGNDHNNLFCPENWWAADIASFSNQAPAFYAISALEDSDLFYLNFQVLERLYLAVPKLERFFRVMFQNGFSLYQQRITSNLSNTAEERLELFRKQYPKLEQRITQKHIASYLGITPVFLSMIRSRSV
jgi:CRP-like cAMP-binding protein